MTDEQLAILLQEEAARIRLTDDEHMQMRANMQEFLEMKRVSASENTRQHKSMKNITAVLSADEKPALKNEEREAMREHLQRFMEQSREDQPVYEESVGIVEWFADLLRGAFPRMAMIAGAFVVVGSGAAYAAEQSVPGGILYPLKISVVEPLRGRLAYTDEEKAEWEVQLAVRRLQEVERLEKDVVIEESSKAEIRQRFSVHVKNASRHIESLSRADNAKAVRMSEDFTNRLRTHQAILSVIEVEDDDEMKFMVVQPVAFTGSAVEAAAAFTVSSDAPAIIAVPVVNVVPAAVVEKTEKSIDVLKNVLKEVPVPAILRKSSKSSKPKSSSVPHASSVFSSVVSSIIHSSLGASSVHSSFQSSVGASSVIAASSIPASSLGTSSVAAPSSVQASSVPAVSSQPIIDLPPLPIVDPVLEGLGL